LSFVNLHRSHLARPSLHEVATTSGRYPPLKVLAVVGAGRVVRVVIPADGRDQAALLYDPAGWPTAYSEGLGLSDGDAAVHACADRDPRFNGGFLIAEPGCIDIEAYVDDATEPLHLGAPSGAQCPP
jgi:hypothetical protein